MILITTLITTGLLFAILILIGTISDGTDTEVALAFLITIILLIATFWSWSAMSERRNLQEYHLNDLQLETVKARQEEVKEETDNLIKQLPQDTMKLYRDLSSKDGQLNIYPNIEFVNLIQEQMKTQKELQTKITSLEQEQALILGEMENRRRFFPGRIFYRTEPKVILGIE